MHLGLVQAEEALLSQRFEEFSGHGSGQLLRRIGVGEQCVGEAISFEGNIGETVATADCVTMS